MNKKEQGQILLVTVLIMLVVLTISFSVVSRSIIQVKTAQDEADSQKAFSAAEAGIDQVLKTGTQTTNQSLGNNAVINNAHVDTVSTSPFLINNNALILQDEGADVWLSSYPSYSSPWTGRLRVYWGTGTQCSEAALEAIVISQASPYMMTRYAYDPCNARSTSNNFTSASVRVTTISGTTLRYSFPMDITNGLLVRLIPLYTNTIIGVAGFVDSFEASSKSLPSQGQRIVSTGAAGNTQRQISYFQGYGQVPSALFYSLFSP